MGFLGLDNGWIVAGADEPVRSEPKIEYLVVAQVSLRPLALSERDR